jgi:hypothetical protein
VVDEAENASEANTPSELCRWRGACFTPCGKGRAENCANVRNADLRLGKGQSRRKKAIRLWAIVIDSRIGDAMLQSLTLFQ